MKSYVFRLMPGQKLREEIDAVVSKEKIQAGIITCCVGNLSQVVMRLADGKTIKTLTGTFEITGITGTVEGGNSHIHITVADEHGNVFGGHLKNESIVGITAEVAILALPHTKFTRVYDETTGYDELEVIEEVKP